MNTMYHTVQNLNKKYRSNVPWSCNFSECMVSTSVQYITHTSTLKLEGALMCELLTVRIR